MKEENINKEENLSEAKAAGVEEKSEKMPRKTVYLLIGLIMVTIILLALALYNFNGNGAKPTTTQEATKSTSPSYAKAILNILPPQQVVNANGSKTYTVIIRINTPATGLNKISAAQLDISYDPKALSNVDVKAGSLLKNPIVLLKKIDTVKGIINFDLAPSPSEKTSFIAGDLAEITFTKNPSAKGTTALNFLPSTIITSGNFAENVLKGAYGTSFNLNSQ